MKIKIIGRGIEITDGLRQAVEDKLSKLEKYFVPETEIIAMTQCWKGQSEDWGNNSSKGNYY